MSAITKTDIRLGAIYRFGCKRRLDRACLASLLTTRAGMNARDAAALAGHWITTAPYRATIVPHD